MQSYITINSCIQLKPRNEPTEIIRCRFAPVAHLKEIRRSYDLSYIM